MKAALFTGPEEIVVREVPDPPLPPDGLILQVMACGVCGSDLRRWRQGPMPGAGDQIPGHEVSGVVVAVGEALRDRYREGDRLALAPDVHCGRCYYCRRGWYNLCDDLRIVGITPGYAGGFAERMVITGEILQNGIVHPLPDGLSFVEGALAEPLSSVLAAHQMAQTSLGNRVVIIGAGPIGCLHIAVAKRRGARVLIAQRSAPRRALAARFGPDVIVDPTEQDLVEAVLAWTDGLGADIAICANPVAATQEQAVRLVRKRGQVILFGGLPRTNPMTTLDGNRIHYGEIRLFGVFSYHPSMHELALQMMGEGIVAADQIVTHTFSLEETPQAFRTAAQGEGLKVMVKPSAA
ncbi:MAG: alcohol dehydrogenase catalytic domain-containing protein [Chloroflexi bacterium]|nr:alcohol dehydrogenase catalytic domain-containing protein [Chloroflexota bacterium]